MNRKEVKKLKKVKKGIVKHKILLLELFEDSPTYRGAFVDVALELEGIENWIDVLLEYNQGD